MYQDLDKVAERYQVATNWIWALISKGVIHSHSDKSDSRRRILICLDDFVKYIEQHPDEFNERVERLAQNRRSEKLIRD